MQIKVIYEDDTTLRIKELIAQLDNRQFFFIEQYLKQKKLERKQQIFKQWKHTLYQLTKHS